MTLLRRRWGSHASHLRLLSAVRLCPSTGGAEIARVASSFPLLLSDFFFAGGVEIVRVAFVAPSLPPDFVALQEGDGILQLQSGIHAFVSFFLSQHEFSVTILDQSHVLIKLSNDLDYSRVFLP
ncbi:hypothetical protein IEQ34_004524 [Dendrobium chrysotoxum]|uniref:Uncharacterized protein n=1 Tax=Dendrobium chrysotoxum TaxID=161865 RepID=A0AAV7HFG4_DENCH|nr:hypothetical protein IEQ34_004524 [Dendrobium chrysotoxum]